MRPSRQNKEKKGSPSTSLKIASPILLFDVVLDISFILQSKSPHRKSPRCFKAKSPHKKSPRCFKAKSPYQGHVSISRPCHHFKAKSLFQGQVAKSSVVIEPAISPSTLTSFIFQSNHVANLK